MPRPFNESLKRISGQSINKVEFDNDTTTIYFSNGDKVSATYWRLIGLPNERLSSFDNGQKYGLSEKIDAPKSLAKVVVGKTVSTATIDMDSGDLEFRLLDGLKFQVFNFSGNEVWEVEFQDGGGQLSNYV